MPWHLHMVTVKIASPLSQRVPSMLWGGHVQRSVKMTTKEIVLDISYIRRSHMKNYGDWFAESPFEAHFTLRIPTGIPIDMAHEIYAREVLLPLSDHISDKIGAITVIVPRTSGKQAHMHSLVISTTKNIINGQLDAIQSFVSNLKGTKLIDCKKACVITGSQDMVTKCHYVANHLSQDNAVLKMYRERLIKYRSNTLH